MSQNSTHSTDDLSFAAYLHSLTFTIASLDRSNPERVSFVFSMPDEDWENFTKAWQTGTCVCNPRQYYSSYQALKGKIFYDDVK